MLRNTSGFVYYVSITGITGAAAAEAAEVGPEVARIKAQTDLPVIVGFGIRTPEQAAAVGALPAAEGAAGLALLPPEVAASVLAELPSAVASALLQAMDPAAAGALVVSERTAPARSTSPPPAARGPLPSTC